MSFLRDRSIQTLWLAAILVGVLASARPPPRGFVIRTGENSDRFWAEKARISNELDIALAGDSRVYDGLSPEAMREDLGNVRVRNLGFSGVALAEPYLTYIARSLAPDARAPTLVIGMTPHAFTPAAAAANGYLTEAHRTIPEIYERIYLSPVRYAFRPFMDPESSDAFGEHKKVPHYYKDFQPDGWVRSWLEPPAPDRALREYHDLFTASKVDTALLRAFAGSVAQWRAAGIRVVTFRPPTSVAMRALEERESGYDEATARALIEAAGGEYIAIDADAYETYDGSHLLPAAAVRFSRDMATLIAQK